MSAIVSMIMVATVALATLRTGGDHLNSIVSTSQAMDYAISTNKMVLLLLVVVAIACFVYVTNMRNRWESNFSDGFRLLHVMYTSTWIF